MESVKILLVLCFLLECCNCWVNRFDGPLSYECAVGEQLIKISSRHINFYEDRQFDFECKKLGTLESCNWHSNINQYDKLMDFKCPGTGAISGVKSIHSNYYEDRVFDIKCCNVATAAKSEECTWTSYVNNYDQEFNYNVPSNKYISGIYSIHSNHYEDRRYKFLLCNLPQ